MPKKTFKLVKESGNDAIIQLKGNQKNLQKNCKKIELEKEKLGEIKTENKGRNREEIRIMKKYKFENITNKLSKEWEENVKELVIVERYIKKKNTKTKSLSNNNLQFF